MWKWEEIEKLNICDIDDGALDTEFDLTPEGCLWQDWTTCFNLAHAAIKYDFESEEGFTFCAFPPFNTLSTEKFKRGSGLSDENFQVAVVEGGRCIQRRLLDKLNVLKASGTETNLLGNQQRRLHQLQNGLWGGDEHRDIWSAPIPNSGLVRQRWQGNLESNSTQSAEGSDWDQILRKILKQKEIRGRFPILAGL